MEVQRGLATTAKMSEAAREIIDRYLDLCLLSHKVTLPTYPTHLISTTPRTIVIMPVRIQPLRVLLGQRSLHTSSCVLQSEGSTPAAPPKPRSFTDLGFGTSNANRTRDLPRLDLGSIGGDIGVKSSTDRAPQAPVCLDTSSCAVITS